MQDNFSVINKTRGRIPSLQFLKIKNEILGKNYDLSIAFVPPTQSRILNKTYRKKDKPTNILSFVLSKNSGELVLCPHVIKKEMKNFDRNYSEFIGFLVIHGMLHLKGMKHSSTMREIEEKYDKKYFSGNRRGLKHDQSRRGRISKRRKKS